MFRFRQLVLSLGIVLLVCGGWWAWRSSQPTLSDKEQIIANIEAIRVAVQEGSVSRIASFLDKDFTWSGTDKEELLKIMQGAFMRWRAVVANVTALRVEVNKNNAVATGKYSLAMRPAPKARPEVHLGNFTLYFEKRDGEWLITRADGGENKE